MPEWLELLFIVKVLSFVLVFPRWVAFYRYSVNTNRPDFGVITGNFKKGKKITFITLLE